MLEILILFAFFTSIGSFSSLVMHRLPIIESSNKSISLISPRSYCPHCEQTLPIKSLIPIFSFIIYQGKCSICHEKIAISYLVNEFIHLLVGGAIFYYLGLTPIFIFTYLIFSLLFILLILDFKYLYLPILINLMFVLVGMVGNICFELFIPSLDGIIKISIVEQVLLGFVLGYLSLWLINTMYKIFKKKDGIGGGDFILFGGIGTVLGPFILPLIMLLGSIFSIAFYIFNIRKNIESNEIPLGSGLICGFFMYVIIKFFELNIFLVVL